MGSVGRRVEEPHTAELQPLVSPFPSSNNIVLDIAGLVYSLPFFFPLAQWTSNKLLFHWKGCLWSPLLSSSRFTSQRGHWCAINAIKCFLDKCQQSASYFTILCNFFNFFFLSSCCVKCICGFLPSTQKSQNLFYFSSDWWSFLPAVGLLAEVDTLRVCSSITNSKTMPWSLAVYLLYFYSSFSLPPLCFYSL